MSQSVTMPSSLTLAALLYRLSRLGWAQVDLDRLTRVYETFQSRTGTLLQVPPELKGLIAAAEEAFPKRTKP